MIINGKEFEKLLFDLKITKKEASERLKISRRALYDWLVLEEFPPKIAQRVSLCFAKDIEDLNTKSFEKQLLPAFLECKNSEITALKEVIEMQKKLIQKLENENEQLKKDYVLTPIIAAESQVKYGGKRE